MAIYIDNNLCKCCKLCMDICPKNVFEVSDTINKKGFSVIKAARPEDCIKCKLCEKTCPDFVICVDDL